MPTGYTAKVQEGLITDIKDFVLLCADVDLKEYNLSVKEETSYYSKRLEEEKDELYNLYNSSDEDLQNMLEEKYKIKEKNRTDMLKEIELYAKRYNDMLDKVQEWSPPTENHVGVKDFMIDQLRSSIEFDCSTEFYSKPTEKLSLSDWFDLEENEILDEMSYIIKYIVEDYKKIRSRKKWIKELKDSFS